jgi:hypothetical protein
MILPARPGVTDGTRGGGAGPSSCSTLAGADATGSNNVRPGVRSFACRTQWEWFGSSCEVIGSRAQERSATDAHGCGAPTRSVAAASCPRGLRRPWRTAAGTRDCPDAALPPWKREGPPGTRRDMPARRMQLSPILLCLALKDRPISGPGPASKSGGSGCQSQQYPSIEVERSKP